MLGGHGLRQPFEIAQLDELFIPFGQPVHNLLQCDRIGNHILRRRDRDVDLPGTIFFVRRQGDGGHGGGQHLRRLRDIHPQVLRKLADGRLLPALSGQALLFPQGVAGLLLHCPANLHRPAIAKNPADFPQNHRHGIGGESEAARRIEAIRRFNQAHAASLKEVVIFHAAAAEAVCAGMDEPQIV